MESGRELWTGVLNGIAIVYDPSIQTPNSRWVLLYAVPHQRLIAYHKAHARSVSHAHSDHDARRAALGAYENWRRTIANSVLEEATQEIHRKDAFLNKKLAEVIEKHRQRLQDHSLAYLGTTEPDGRDPIRNPLCRGCHRAIGNDTHLLCNACHWIICLSCGTCGCGD